MQFLNYHHLLYFWTVAREGSVVQAAQKLLLAPSTVSSQVHALEDAMEAKLLERAGRGLRLTDTGQLVYRYADEIFMLGRELQDVLGGRPLDRPLRLEVGISNTLPQLMARKLLKPALDIDRQIQLSCEEGESAKLLTALEQHRLDVVLLDTPAPQSAAARLHTQVLGECELMIFGTAGLVHGCKDNYPRCLDKAPFLMPREPSAARRALDEWFTRNGVRPKLVGEFSDSSLLNVFGREGSGLFAAPALVQDEVCQQYDVEVAGVVEGVRVSYYAISLERRLKHAAVAAIARTANERLSKAC